jgi:hypothetical protein
VKEQGIDANGVKRRGGMVMKHVMMELMMLAGVQREARLHNTTESDTVAKQILICISISYFCLFLLRRFVETKLIHFR